MDLGTIKKKLQYNVYKDATEFIDDVELVFYNCRTYNGTTSEVGQIGVACNQEFERLLNSYGVRERFCNNRDEEEMIQNNDENQMQEESVNNQNTFQSQICHNVPGVSTNTLGLETQEDIVNEHQTGPAENF